MARPPADWSTHQLAEFLSFVTSRTDEDEALRVALERAAEAVEAELGVILLDRAPVASLGFPGGAVPPGVVDELRRGDSSPALPLPGPAVSVAVPIEGAREGSMVLTRLGEVAFSAEERSLLRAMGRVLSLALGMLERQKLLDRLSRIQRSISHRAPLPEVLDAIVAGARELLGAEVVGLRLIDPDDPGYSRIAASSGVPPDMLRQIERAPVDQGAGGRAIVEDRLIIMENYAEDPNAVPALAADRLRTAMAAPVREEGKVVGSLVVASYGPRRFSAMEQEALLALAEHASLALTDSTTLEAMREAQRSKDMFLAMVSHELRTPLTVIMGVLRTLEDHRDEMAPELVGELLSSGFRRGRDLERLIDRLLRGAHAELAGDQEETSAQEVVSDIVAGTDHAGRVKVEAVSEQRVRVNRSAVAEVAGILVENAIGHSPAGSPVWVSARVEGSDLVMAVRNRGSLPDGLDPRSLFQPFQRGAEARSPGVGLGLYIADRVARAADGHVEVRSGGGMVTFEARFPAQLLDPAGERRAGRRQRSGGS